MAKSESFFLRQTLAQTGSGFVQAEIDLGAFVNLGTKSGTIMRIHQVEVQITDRDAPMSGPYKTNANLNIGWDLTTTQQAALVKASDRSVVASGRYEVTADAGGLIDFAQDTRDVMPQNWTNGYLIGVDTLYFQSQADDASTGGTYDLSIVIEATLEKASQANATALALSQQ